MTPSAISAARAKIASGWFIFNVSIVARATGVSPTNANGYAIRRGAD
jgi:hypothetical protein